MRGRSDKAEKSAARAKEKARWRKEQLVMMLGGLCMGCGNEFPLSVYDFHHKDADEKKFNISQEIHTASNDRFENYVVPEAGKCLLFCSNCHRKLHWEDK